MDVLPAGALDVLGEAWERATTPHPPPTAGIATLTALLALVAVATPVAWRVARHLLTLVHEGSHALAAILTGRRLAGIRLHSDTSGLTVSVGPHRGPGMIVTAAAGYPGPAALGLVAAWLLGRGYSVAVLWVLLAAAVLLLAAVRNLHGAVVVVAVGGGLLAVTWWAPVGWQVALAWTVTWFLLLGAPRTVLELQRQRRRARRSGRRLASDAEVLADLTRLPGWSWVAGFALTNVLALVAGARWILAPLVTG